MTKQLSKQELYRKKQKEKGLTLVQLWVYPSGREDLQQYAEYLRTRDENKPKRERSTNRVRKTK